MSPSRIGGLDDVFNSLYNLLGSDELRGTGREREQSAGEVQHAREDAAAVWAAAREEV